MESPRPTVLIADDHVQLHPLLRRILEPAMQVVGDVYDGRALVAAAADLNPDVLVVDVAMPLMDGVDAVRHLRRSGNRAAVVFISTDAANGNVERALAAGADVFVQKGAAAEHLLDAARAALRGQRFICQRT